MTKIAFFGEQILESGYGVNANECYISNLQKPSKACVNASQVDPLMDRPKHTQDRQCHRGMDLHECKGGKSQGK